MKNIFLAWLVVGIVSIKAIPKELEDIKARFAAIGTAQTIDSEVIKIGALEIAVSQKIRDNHKTLADAIQNYATIAADLQLRLSNGSRRAETKQVGPLDLSDLIRNLENAKIKVKAYLDHLENKK